MHDRYYRERLLGQGSAATNMQQSRHPAQATSMPAAFRELALARERFEPEAIPESPLSWRRPEALFNSEAGHPGRPQYVRPSFAADTALRSTSPANVESRGPNALECE